MASDKKKEQDIVIIKKLKVNYELRYNYIKILSEYIKRLPKEHRFIRKDSVIDENGNQKDDWVRTISQEKIGEILFFIIDNKIDFAFKNISSESLKFFKDEYLKRQKRISEILKFKEDLISDKENEYFPFLKIQPYDYQKKAIRFFELNNGVAILGDQPGVGKTCPAFAYAVKNKLKTLIVCPSSLKLMWRKEILKFTNEKAFVYKFFPKKKSEIKNFSKEESMFHIINYEALESYIKLEFKHKCSGNIINLNNKISKCSWETIDLNKKYKKCPICKNTGKIKAKFNGLVSFPDSSGIFLDPSEYDLIIIDECHRMKEMGTTWTKIIHEAFSVIKNKILLSGTVIKSRPIEFFSTLNFIMPEEWKNYHEFGVRYGAGFQDKFGWDYNGASNLEELFTRVSPYFLRRLKRDVLAELPPKTYLEIPIELDEKEYTEYKKILKEVKKEIVDGKEVDKKETYLSKIHKLKMFTGRIKAITIKDVIEDIINSGEKVVVVSEYIEIAKQIAKDFEGVSVLHTGEMTDIEKQTSVDKFQEDKNIKLFSGMILASGVGITLTAASKIIKIGFAWTPADEEQIEDRIHRANTKFTNIEVITPYCIDTIDEDIMTLLDDKSYIVSKTLDNKEFKKNKVSSSENIFKELMEIIKNK